MAQEPSQAQAGHRGHCSNEGQRIGRVRIDPATVEADIDFNQDVECSSGQAHGLRPAARDQQVVDDDRDGGAVHQTEDAFGVGRMDGIGQADVRDAGGGEDFRFPNFRTADTGGASVDLPAGDSRRLVRLDVRPQTRAGRFGKPLGALDIAADASLSEQRAWGGAGLHLVNCHLLGHSNCSELTR
jgi:hypothetical protein